MVLASGLHTQSRHLGKCFVVGIVTKSFIEETET